MAKVLITENNLSAIGNAIRGKNGSSTRYLPSEMAQAISDIDAGYPEPTGTVNISANGTGVNVKDYALADVNVPNSYESTDEGKVVSNGALVSQTSRTVTANGTIDTTLNNEVVVNVEGGGSAVVQPLSVTQNGTYTPPSGIDGYAPVTVNVSGGGGSDIESWDFTTESLVGTTRGITITANNVTIDSSGVTFDNTNDYLLVPVSLAPMTIEIDVTSMVLTASNHRRFIMSTSDKGFIYRNTGAWALYNGAWEMSNITDGSFFDDSTVKVIIDADGSWHIYKDNVLVWEPTLKLALSNSYFYIGAYSSSINNAVISDLRILV